MRSCIMPFPVRWHFASWRVVLLEIIKSVQLHPNRGSHPFCFYNEWLFDNALVSSWYLLFYFRFAKLWKKTAKLWPCICVNIMFFNESFWGYHVEEKRERCTRIIVTKYMNTVYDVLKLIGTSTTYRWKKYLLIRLFWKSPVLFGISL